jgi:hypothetical protein
MSVLLETANGIDKVSSLLRQLPVTQSKWPEVLRHEAALFERLHSCGYLLLDTVVPLRYYRDQQHPPRLSTMRTRRVSHFWGW